MSTVLILKLKTWKTTNVSGTHFRTYLSDLVIALLPRMNGEAGLKIHLKTPPITFNMNDLQTLTWG